MWSLAFCLVGVMVTFTAAGQVRITTPRVIVRPNGDCIFPEILTLELAVRYPHVEQTIQLKRNLVIPSARTVLIMSDLHPGSLTELPVVSDKHNGIQGYHSQSHGAAFTVKCVHAQVTHRAYYLLEGSVFVAHQKYRVTPTPFWRERAVVFPSHVTTVYTMTKIEDFKAGDKAAISRQDEEYIKKMARMNATSSRHKRAVTLPAVYNIDIRTVVDGSFYQRMYNNNNGDVNQTLNSILDYLAILFTAVSMRINTMELQNRTLTIRMQTPVILMNANQSPYNASHLELKNGDYMINALTLLSLFTDWLVRTPNLGSYDHAMFITAVDIYGGGDSGIKFNVTKGLANVGKLCQGKGESASVIEDKGAYQSEGVVAHELSHGFGSVHDGENNTCNSADRFIMSDGTYPETDSNKLNPWKFSHCSSESVLKLLQQLERNATLLQKCLVDSSGAVEHDLNTISGDYQCKAFYGNDSFVCRGANVPSLDQMCDEFYCRIPGTELCERMEAATGTCCGNQKKCSQGLCVDAGQGECPVNDTCPLGDQPGIILNNMTCAQLDIAYCYSNDIYLKCCATCLKHYNRGNAGCIYGDKQLGCVEKNCGSYFVDGDYKDLPYDYICCATCQSSQCSDVDVLPISGVDYTCSDYILNQGNEFVCYQQSILQHSCCKSCNDARDVINPACPWGDRRNCSSLLRKTGYTCTDTDLENCCKTCSDLNKARTTAKVTTTTSTTKTLSTTTIKISTTKTSKSPPVVKPSEKTSDADDTTTPSKCPDLLRCQTSNLVSVSLLCVLMAIHHCLIKWLSN